MPRTISIIGASAGVGLRAVHTALERGHHVVSLSRQVSSLPRHPRLHALQGSATSTPDLRAAVQGADAVLVTLGTGMDRKPTTLYTDFANALLPLQAELGSTPVVVLTGFGAGDSARYQGWVAKVLFRLLLKAVYDNKSAMEGMLAASPLNWCCVRPGMLTNASPDGPAKVQTDYRPGMRVGPVSRQAVARFMVEQAEHFTCAQGKPALSAR